MAGRLLLLLLLSSAAAPAAQRSPRAPLEAADIEQIAQLLMLEDTRTYDESALAAMLRSTHPEVRRRAAITIGRLADTRGLALLERTWTDAEIAREVAFAYGQLKDGSAVAWLGGRLTAPNVPTTVRQEAARSLGKIRTPEARAALETFIGDAVTGDAAVGEALLSLGRFPEDGERLDHIKRLAVGPSTPSSVVWQATWALYRPRDPAAVPDLLRLATHPDPDVRFWAVRGLAAPPDDVTAIVAESERTARLRDAAQDADRRVRTEAIRALATYDDDASFEMVLKALDSPDPWLSVSAAELLRRYESRRDQIMPRLAAASGDTRPAWLRAVAGQTLGRLESLPAEPEVPNPAQRGAGAGRGGGRGNAAGGGRGAQPPDTRGRTIEDYRRIAERWIVAGFNRGAPSPVLELETPRGTIAIALHAAEAPLAMEYLVEAVETGAIVGTEFGRLVPNFVAQQATIEGAPRLRDEVNMRGLNRGTLAWASAGLDTGRPGYTLGHTAQPHNEGDFTALGHVIGSMEAVDLLQLGDAILAARLSTPGR